jgi:Transposase DDE domain
MNATSSQERIDAEVARMLAEAQAADADACGERQDPPVPRGGRAQRLARLQEAKLDEEDEAATAAYQRRVAERAAKEKALGQKIRGRKSREPVADMSKRVNTSDPDTRVMSAKGGWLQAYNAQIAVTASQVIIAAGISAQTNDQQLLHPMLEAAASTLQEAGVTGSMGTLLADAGYCIDANLAAASPDGPVLLMPPYNTRKDRDAAKAREQLGNRAPKARFAKADMERRYASEEGQALYRPRCQTVELVFGQIKEARRCRRFQRRDRQAAESEWNLICATHNLLKLFRHTSEAAPAPAPTLAAG